MKLLLLIGTGSLIGGLGRYGLSLWLQARVLTAFPYGTLAVNLAGCFFVGLVYVISERWNLSAEWRLFLATGLLGGFTTFSAFSLETVSMVRDGQWLYVAGYVGASVLLGLAATFAGMILPEII